MKLKKSYSLLLVLNATLMLSACSSMFSGGYSVQQAQEAAATTAKQSANMPVHKGSYRGDNYRSHFTAYYQNHTPVMISESFVGQENQVRMARYYFEEGKLYYYKESCDVEKPQYSKKVDKHVHMDLFYDWSGELTQAKKIVNRQTQKPTDGQVHWIYQHGALLFRSANDLHKVKSKQ